MSTWLIRLSAQLPAEMDPEVRADLIERTRLAVGDWPGVQVWRLVGGWSVVAVVLSEHPHELIVELPLYPWLTVNIEPLAAFQ